MKANSNGSVTPQTNAQIAAEATKLTAIFFFFSFAVCTIANADQTESANG